MEWTGHVVRMDQRRTVKKIFECKSEVSRRTGRPRLRWLENAEKGLLETQVKRWRPKAVDREERASVMKKARLSEGRGARIESSAS